jgi:outer membrane lipoprotein SlyB
MINKMKKLFILLLVAAVVSLGLTGCKQHHDQSSEDHPTSDHPQ